MGMTETEAVGTGPEAQAAIFFCRVSLILGCGSKAWTNPEGPLRAAISEVMMPILAPMSTVISPLRTMRAIISLTRKSDRPSVSIALPCTSLGSKRRVSPQGVIAEPAFFVMPKPQARRLRICAGRKMYSGLIKRIYTRLRFVV